MVGTTTFSESSLGARSSRLPDLGLPLPTLSAMRLDSVSRGYVGGDYKHVPC